MSRRLCVVSRALLAALLPSLSVAPPAVAEESGTVVIVSSTNTDDLLQDNAIVRVTRRGGRRSENFVHLPKVSLTWNPVTITARTGELVVSREIEGGLTDMIEGGDFTAPRVTFTPKEGGDFRLSHCEGLRDNVWRGDGGTWFRCRVESLADGGRPVLWTPELYEKVFQEAQEGKLFDLQIQLTIEPWIRVVQPAKSVDADFRWDQMPALADVATSVAYASEGRGREGWFPLEKAKAIVGSVLDHALANPCAGRAGATLSVGAAEVASNDPDAPTIGLEDACRKIEQAPDQEAAMNHLRQALQKEAWPQLLLITGIYAKIATREQIKAREAAEGRPRITVHLYDVAGRETYEARGPLQLRYTPRFVPTYN